MTTLYVITRVLTYFGTEMRTFLEHIMCRVFKIVAEDVRSFKSSELCGHVEHELTQSLSQSFFMCFIPFFVNFILGCCLLLTGSYRLFYIGDGKSLIGYITLWLGISLLANCSPSFEDALSFKDYLYGGKNIFLKIILSPFFAVAYVCAFLERYSVTFVFTVVFSVAFPYLFSFVFPLIDKLFPTA